MENLHAAENVIYNIIIIKAIERTKTPDSIVFLPNIQNMLEYLDLGYTTTLHSVKQHLLFF
jgi:hypothetical protein